MEITEVRISPAKGSKIRGFASIVIDDCFIINDLRVMEGKEGQLYITMPARKVRNGQLRDIAHPLNSDTRKDIEERVLEEFHRSVENLSMPNEDKPPQGNENGSLMDRLASKLFAEDFWTVDSVAGGDDES